MFRDLGCQASDPCLASRSPCFASGIDDSFLQHPEATVAARYDEEEKEVTSSRGAWRLPWPPPSIAIAAAVAAERC